MARTPITRAPGESHDELWALMLRFSQWRDRPVHNHAGERYGSWRVLGLDGWGSAGMIWLIECQCGKRARRKMKNLLLGVSRSCGCTDMRTTHGMSRTRPYKIWAGMLSRCRSPNDDNYAIYGGRGITFAPEWVEFEAFWRDMAVGYSEALTLERVDVNGNYEPGNCTWIPKSDQLQNLRRTVRIPTPKGVMTLRQASNVFGINRGTLRGRIRYGWPPERLLEGYC